MSQPMARELVHIPFRDSEVLAVEIDGAPWVVLRPAFTAIGLRADWQIDKVQSQEWATTCVTQVVAEDGRLRDMIVADLRTFLMALATIPASRVSESARPLLVAYQREVSYAIESYWTRGFAANPHASGYSPRLLSLDEAAAVLRQQYGLPFATPVDLTRAMRAAGITRLSGGSKAAHGNLLWFNGSAWLVVAEFVGELAKVLGRTEAKVGEQLDRGVQLRLELADSPP